MHPLDNVIWESLGTRHAPFAQSFGEARRFVPEIGPLTGFREASDEGYESLAGLPGDGSIGLFLNEPYVARPGWDLVDGAPLLQMVFQDTSGLPASNGHSEIVELVDTDSPEMLELATLTKPGPFNRRTHDLGTFFGIRCEGKLVAMAGERLKVPGFTEVSGVCTHPEHIGRGYARILMLELMRRIRDRGETPFLHVRDQNRRAIELYERLGFRTRVVRHYARLKKTLPLQLTIS